ncbi:XdhC/CoxI family protein [Clostridium sediminicola]|uniref:XdhC family protein n=1 Tax=Clostridium sediminicola TaxID=3114879 RepID=UPI0031F1EA7E
MEIHLVKKLSQSLEENKDVALVTITNVHGSSPRGKGSMMLVDKDGDLLEGTIGGGAVEEKAKSDAAECIKRGISKSIYYVLDQDKGSDSLQMACGGDIDIFVKVFHSSEQLIIVGAGHIAVKLSKVAGILGYKITIIDDRKEFATRERFPEAQEIMVGDVGENLRKCSIEEKTNIVIVTHGHNDDQIALEAVIDSKSRYIGMIGSFKKVKESFKALEDKGFSQEKINKVHAPIGIDIGGEKPEEIALSIMAEIQAVEYGKIGQIKSLYL